MVDKKGPQLNWRGDLTSGEGARCVTKAVEIVCLLVGCLTSQQQASVSQGRISSDNFTCCHTEIEVAYLTFYLTQSQYTDTGPTSPIADPITPGAWRGSHWSANFEVTGMTRPRKKSLLKRDSNPGSSALEVDALPLGQRGGSCREEEPETATTFSPGDLHARVRYTELSKESSAGSCFDLSFGPGKVQ